MPTPEPRTTPCGSALRSGRQHKAEQFFDAAEIIDALVDDEADLVDAYVTLCIHAGIAAADAICCARLGRHARGQDHREAVELVRRVGTEPARDLDTLLRMKTKAGYSGLLPYRPHGAAISSAFGEPGVGGGRDPRPARRPGTARGAGDARR